MKRQLNSKPVNCALVTNTKNFLCLKITEEISYKRSKFLNGWAQVVINYAGLLQMKSVELNFSIGITWLRFEQ